MAAVSTSSNAMWKEKHNFELFRTAKYSVSVWYYILVLTALTTVALADHRVVLENKCGEKIWVGILASHGPLPSNGGFALEPGTNRELSLPPKWGGRFWGRAGCSDDGRNCASGDCGRGVECAGAGGNPPATLAEVTFDGDGGLDFYDVSLVDGYNMPVSMQPIDDTVRRRGGQYDCTRAGCDRDLNPTCPGELQVKRGDTVVGCKSACAAFNTDAFCCKGPNNRPETCPPFDYSRAFKAACPNAYSYAYDDQASTFTCANKNDGSSGYTIQFCTGGGGPSPPSGPGGTINWNGDWAMGCDFPGNDMSNVQIRGEDCSNKCASTNGCTHYAWTRFNGGTCWLKSGDASKADAMVSSEEGAVCGVKS